MNATADVSLREYDDLVSGNLRTAHFNRATLTARGVGDDRRFLMTGPSGIHSLLVVATDLDRLNAHWTVFATDPRNARPA